MISFSYLDKSQKDQWLPILFDLLYENMSVIAPSEEPYEAQKEEWFGNVSPALDKAPRQIILCFADGKFAGYVQYYTRDDLLMVEELQIQKAYQRTTLFAALWKHLRVLLPDSIHYIEAYADPRNTNSLTIMKKLGMEPMEFGNPAFVHLRGKIKNDFREKETGR